MFHTLTSDIHPESGYIPPVTDINKEIETRVSAFVSELTELVRKAAIEAVASVLGTGSAPARGRKPATATAVIVAHKAPAASRGGKRTSSQITATVATVLGYIKAHPNMRSEKIREDLKMPRPVMRDALDRLAATKKIKMKGIKRAATYTAA